MKYAISWFERPQGSPAVRGELEVIAWRDGLKGR
jgi:hypothetical protein